MPHNKIGSLVFIQNPNSDLDDQIETIIDTFGTVPSTLISIFLGIPTHEADRRLRRLQRFNKIKLVTAKRVNFWQKANEEGKNEKSQKVHRKDSQ